MKARKGRTGGSAELHIGDLVRIQPCGGEQHFGRGVVIDVRRAQVLVKPFPDHGHNEWIPLSGLRPWKSANEQYRRIAEGRKHA